MNEYRALDANINRSCEGLRILEDIARFQFDDRKMSSDLRRIRHEIRDLLKGSANVLLSFRDALHDVGITTSALEATDQRKNLKDTVLSNFKRAQEALRSMEELLKTAKLSKSMKTYDVVIFTVKAKPDRGLVNGKTGTQLVWEWLKKYDMDRYVTKVTSEKPRAVAYIDDKSIHFDNWKMCLDNLGSIENERSVT